MEQKMSDQNRKLWPFKPRNAFVSSILILALSLAAFVIAKTIYAWPGEGLERIILFGIFILSLLPILFRLADILIERSKQEKDKQKSHIKPQLSITPEEYMMDRLVYKIHVYDRLSKRHELLYKATSLVGIILAASVPVLINLQVNSIVPTVLSLIVTILVSVEKLFHFREHWRNYDEMAAILRSEQLKFQTRAGEYAPKEQAPDQNKNFNEAQNPEAGEPVTEGQQTDGNQNVAETQNATSGKHVRKDHNSDSAFKMFVSRIEQAISDERKETIEMRTREDAAK
ncbi:MAG: hypothetical protein DKINENOH_03050 [bacterium]|nr:hypothetical protein [bacterium]